MGIYSTIVCVSVMLTIISSCTPANGDGKLIAFLSTDMIEDGQIYFMNVDGSNPTRLNTGLADTRCPLWFPDGQKLLFVSANGTGNGLDRELNLYTINKDGSELTKLTDGPGDVYSAAWSPDGRQVAFIAGTDDGRRPIFLYSMNADGSNIKQLTFLDFAYSYRDPSWSPDGNGIVFSSNPPSEERAENPNYSLFILELENNKIQQLTKDDPLRWRQYLGADWSPDGKQLVAYAKDTWSRTSYGIQIISLDDSEIMEIASPSDVIRDESPKWSPNGQKIVFSSNRDHIDTDQPPGFDIYVMNADGSNILRLTNSGNNFCPDWQP